MEEPHLPRTQGHHYQQDPQHNPSGLEGEEDENHHEKKSVLTRVKAKARKIKNTFTKHNHDQNADEDADEVVEDPETHRAPIYESDAVRSAVLSPTGQPLANLERPSVMAEDRNDSKMADPPVRPFNQWQEEEYGQPKGNLSGLTAKDEVHHLPEDKHVSFSTGNYDIGNHNPTGENLPGQEESPGQERNKIGFSTAIEGIRGSYGKNIIGQEQNLGGQMGRIGMDTGKEEDPHGPDVQNVPSHVQAEATDPNGRGSEEAAESHGQFSPEPLRREYSDSVPKSYDPNNPKDLPRDTLSGKPSSQTNTYTGKLASAASSIADAANSAKNAVASKLNYSGNKSIGAPRQEVQGQGDTTKPTSATDYAHEIASPVTKTLAPVYGKVVGARSTIASTGTDNEGEDKGGVSVDLTEKLKPGEEDKTLSEMIPGSFIKHKSEIEQKPKAGEEVSTEGEMITDSFIKPKTEIEQKTKAEEEVSTEGGRGVSEVISDSFRKREPEGSGDRNTMGKVRETVASVYGKVAGAGSTIVSTETDNKGEDKRRVSMDLAEKLKLGEEDKAFSEMIPGSFIKHKSEIEQKPKAGEEVSTEGEMITDSFIKHNTKIEQKTKAGEEVSTEGGRGVSEVISDSFHKRELEGSEDRKPIGKVTETLAPVFGKVAGEGSTIVSTETDNKGEDKGGVSVDLAEKLKSGEEDKALLEMITDSFIKPKAEIKEKTKAGEEVSTEGGRGVSEVISDSFNKRELEGSEDRNPMEKVTETLTPVCGKVAGAGSTILSTGTDNEGEDKGGVSVDLAKKLKPKEEDKALSEMIPGSFIKHKSEIEQKTKAGEEVSTEGEMITDSFIKPNAEIEQKTKAGDEVSTEGGRGVSEVISDSFHKRELEGSEDRNPMEKVTETLAPVCGKVAGAGSTIVSTGIDNEGEDKGGVSVDLAEKLKSGEEDKALSEMITGSFIKPKAEIEQKTKAGEEVSTEGGRGVSEMISDSFHKREPEGNGDRKPMGKVTESEEVDKPLGTGGEEESGGKGVVDRVKGMVGYWLGGKGGDTQTTPGTTYAGDDDHVQKAASE